MNAGDKYARSYSEAYKTQESSLTGEKGKEFYKEQFGTMNLNRKVRIKQYAPNAFRRIRQLSNIKDEVMLQSLDPSNNIK